MEAKTLTAEADADADAAAPETLAAGELVWAKPSKPRRHCWWPARMLAACPASAVRDAQVSYFVDPAVFGAPSAPPARVRRFADADADLMARGSIARGLFGAVEEAHARAVAALRAQLTCACVPPPPPGADCRVTGVANLAPEEFLAALREAALDVSSVGLVDRARLKSWVGAVGEGWGPRGAQHYPRRCPDDLVDKIDLDVPAGEDRDADDWLAEDQYKALERPEETPKQKKRSVSKMMDKWDAAEDDGKIDSAEHVTSGKRERKKSKYLSPPYTNLGVADKITRKPVDLPKALVPKAAEDGRYESPLPGSIVVEDVLLLVRGLGEVPNHTDDFPKDAEEFLRLFRSTTFIHGADYKSCKAHESPLMRGMRGSRNVGMDIAVGLVSVSHAVLKQGSCVSKRGRKKDEAGSGGSSTKRKKREKTSPAATIGAGIPITPAIPIRQVKAEDIRTLMKAGSGPRGIGVGVKNEQGKPSPLKVPISAADPGAAESGHEQAQANVLAVGNSLPEQSAKENDAANLEATRSEMNVQNVTDVPIRSVQTEAMELQANNPIEVSAQSVVVDVPVESVSKEATEPETCVHKDKNVQSDVSDVPDRIVSKEPTELETDNNNINENVCSVAADVSDRSVSKDATMPDADIRIHENLQNAGDLLVSSGLSPMHEDMSQPVDGNKDPGGVEVFAVQQSYASLQAMVPEMLKKVNTNGADTIGVNDTLKDEFQKDGQPVKKVELPAEVANHSCAEGTNGTWLDPANLTPKKKKKKAAQHFSNPAAVIVEFERGATVPSRQELLSTFGKYGYLIESQTDISETTRSACVVFGKSIEAEEAYKNGCQYLLGQFGPPFAKLRLDFSPIKLTLPSPSLASKPPLQDIRKNLEDMISARRSALNATSSDGQLNPVPDKLLGEMQGLLAKVDRMLTRPPANAP
ncbi:unnamed protein product [Miscanthus lutarioriparius]|uniref:PWWP domain-containing protein n=1 Tax=Miscanthus lutarioriparius TaxID=422564 RepID=A0A811P2H0_9POAL|nr:unnamed protein product [Miscanthus lutarioriparius]